jgi:hypothetical protein
LIEVQIQFDYPNLLRSDTPKQIQRLDWVYDV